MRTGARIAAGDNLTSAVVESGFATPSHLADRFKATFGLSAAVDADEDDSGGFGVDHRYGA